MPAHTRHTQIIRVYTQYTQKNNLSVSFTYAEVTKDMFNFCACSERGSAMTKAAETETTRKSSSWATRLSAYNAAAGPNRRRRIGIALPNMPQVHHHYPHVVHSPRLEGCFYQFPRRLLRVALSVHLHTISSESALQIIEMMQHKSAHVHPCAAAVETSALVSPLACFSSAGYASTPRGYRNSDTSCLFS